MPLCAVLKGTRLGANSLKLNLGLTTASADSLLKIGEKHVTNGLGRLTNVILTKGEGSYVTTHEGKQMLDFTCGIGVTNLGETSKISFHCNITYQKTSGHCHPRVTKAAAEQCSSIVHLQVRIRDT